MDVGDQQIGKILVPLVKSEFSSNRKSEERDLNSQLVDLQAEDSRCSVLYSYMLQR